MRNLENFIQEKIKIKKIKKFLLQFFLKYIKLVKKERKIIAIILKK